MVEVIDIEIFKKEVFDFEASQVWQYDKEIPLVLNFFATWCGPCHMFAPILEAVAGEYAGKLKVFKVDIDATPEISVLFGAKSVPTTLFISKGQEPAMASGFMSRESMNKALSELLGIS